MELFGQAGILAILVYVGTKAVLDQKNGLWPEMPQRLRIFFPLVLGIGVVFLVAATVWKGQETFNNVKLVDLNSWSKVVAGLIIGAVAVFGDSVLKTVRNVGQNDYPSPSTNGGQGAPVNMPSPVPKPTAEGQAPSGSVFPGDEG